MVGDWHEATLGDLINSGVASLQTGPFGTALKATEYSDSGMPLISVREIKEGYLEVGSGTPCVSNHTIERLPKFVLRAGDIVFARKGGVDRNAIVKEDQDGWFLGSDGIRLRLDDSLDSRFFSYQMRSSAARAWLLKNSEGTTMPSLNQKILGRIPVAVPPIENQRAIADILVALDDKIELNRRMNRTLEIMARAIFNAWFVDFEPVKAKVAGATSFRGMPQAVFDKLPGRFNNSDLGPVPEGWEYVPIGELVDVFGGGTPNTKNPEFWEGGEYAFCTPKDLSGLPAPVLLDTARHITQSGVDKISSGQLPVGTVILSSRAPIGYLALAETPVSVNQGIIAMVTDDIPNSYILLWAEANMGIIESRAGGSTFAEISKKNFRPIPALRPDDATLSGFGDITKPLFERIASNERESRTLAAVRDTLLPKLISGELQVPTEGGHDGG